MSWFFRSCKSRGLGAALILVVFLASFAPALVLAAPPSANPETYLVQPGDTLFAIALRYHTTIVALKQLNSLKSDTIQVGQKLLVPNADAETAPPRTTSYIVQPGDTLYRIALKFGTTTRALAALNDIPNANLISVGQGLAVPDSVTLTRPGLTIDPQIARQGGTILVRVNRPELSFVKGTFNGASISFYRGGGYYFALIGISRCAKLGAVDLKLTETDNSGQVRTESATVTIEPTAFPVQNIVLPPGKEDLLEPTLVTRENKELDTVVAQYTPIRLWSGTFRQPLTGTISSYFGTRRSYNGGPVGACGHEGFDFSVPGGTPIRSDARGHVVFAGLTQVRGNLTVIDHGLGVFSAYFHQSEIDVKVGQMVNAGDLIGKVGTTGLSTGNHLHWSLFVNGVYVDPLEWTKRVIP